MCNAPLPADSNDREVTLDLGLVTLLAQSAERLVEAGIHRTFAAAMRAMVRANTDPNGPDGIYGAGRCARCGESFRLSQDRAEVFTADGPNVSLLIHAEEYDPATDLLA